MRLLNKIEINLIIIFYFAFLILCLKNDILFEIPLNAFNISILILLVGLIETFYYIYNYHNPVKTFIYIFTSYSITGIAYYILYNIYSQQVKNIPPPNSFSPFHYCDFEWLGKKVYYFKVTSEWIQFIGLSIILTIILKYLFFRLIYLNNFKIYKKEFYIYNAIIIIFFLFFSGFISSIIKANTIYYEDKLYLNKTYYKLYLQYSNQEEKYVINQYIEKYYPTINWKHKEIYSKPNNYYSNFLNLFINNTDEINLINLQAN